MTTGYEVKYYNDVHRIAGALEELVRLAKQEFATDEPCPRCQEPLSEHELRCSES